MPFSRRFSASVTACAVVIVHAFSELSAAEPANANADASAVRAIFKAKCYACHGALDQKAGLRVDTVAAMLKGGDSGPAIEPGQPDDSEIVARIIETDPALRMPPEGNPLDASQLETLRRWISSGASAPANDRPEQDPRDHWAFRTPRRPEIPAHSGSDQKIHPIDALILSDLAKNGLKPTEEADRASLLRRATLDLTGLPPTREELVAFLADESPDAYEKMIDRLLASPAYGQRWARHWMDIWRYADWYGRRYVPDVWNSAPQVYRWRDWIVDSLNRDAGYDHMVQMMIAADELAPGDEKEAVATGYLARNWYALNPHQWKRDIVEHTGKAFMGLTFNCAHCHDHKYDPIRQDDYFKLRAYFEPIELRQDRWPGEADPGPFQKYEYSVLRKVVMHGSVSVFDEKPDARVAVYAGGDEREIVKGREPLGPGLPAMFADKEPVEPVNLPAEAYYPGLKAWVRQALREPLTTEITAARAALKAASDLRKTTQSEIETEVVKSLAGDSSKPVDSAATEKALAKSRRADTAIEAAILRIKSAESALASLEARIQADDVKYREKADPKRVDTFRIAAVNAERKAKIAALKRAVTDAELAAADAVITRSSAAAEKIAEADKAVAATATVLQKARETLTAGSTAALPATYASLTPVYPAKSSGRRAALARSLTRKDHPLTARVAVNHIWNWHFGQPLVESVTDFGRNGKLPSDQRLLDLLAVEFMENGWSLKHLHRFMMTSQAYRRSSSSKGHEAEIAKDPENHLNWKFQRRRLEAEAVRDTILAASGSLSTVAGGPPVENKPEAESTDLRRSLYFSIFPEESGHPKFLETFDAPDSCDAYRRTRSVVPQQALALVNSKIVQDQSKILAEKLWKETEGLGDETARNDRFVTAAFERCLTRQPTPAERLTLAGFLTPDQPSATPESKSPVASAPATQGPPAESRRRSLIRILFNHDDFLTIR
jgi:mono/diheme cytochrome c family protein